MSHNEKEQPPSKRQRAPSPLPHISSHTSSSLTSRPHIPTHSSTSSPSILPVISSETILNSLYPARSFFQPYLADHDVARIWRVSRSASSLLSGYSFNQHIFIAQSAAHLRRINSLFDGYSSRITRMRLSEDFNHSLLDEAIGRSLLPSSLVALALGQIWSVDWAFRMADTASSARKTTLKGDLFRPNRRSDGILIGVQYFSVNRDFRSQLAVSHIAKYSCLEQSPATHFLTSTSRYLSDRSATFDSDALALYD